MLQPNAAPASELGRELRGFLIAGAIGFVIDAGLTAALVHGLSLSPFLARPPALLIAMTTTWHFNRRLAFRSQDPKWMFELLRYFAVSAVGAAINYLIYLLAVAMAGASGLARVYPLPSLVASVALGSAVALAFNFVGARHFAFTGRSRI